MKRKFGVVICLLTSIVLLTGCSGGYSGVGGQLESIGEASYLTDDVNYDMGSSKGYSDGDYSPQMADYLEYATDYSEYDEYLQQSESDIKAMKQMLIRNASVDLTVDSTESFDEWLQKRVAEYDGYFESHDICNWYSEYSTSRTSWFTVRVNHEKLDDFLTSIDGVGTVTRKNISTTDVSLEYSDIEASLKAARNERENLERLMSEAQSVSDVMEISGRISELNGLIESLEKRRRGLENQVTYSTVKIAVTEEREISNPVSLAFKVNFRERLVYAIENFMDMFVGFVFGLPMIALGIFIFVVSMWILRLFWRLIMRRKKGADPAFHYALMPVVNPVPGDDGVKKSKKGLFGRKVKADEFVETPAMESKETEKSDELAVSKENKAETVESEDVTKEQ